MAEQSTVSPVVVALGELVDDLEFVHAQTAEAWATEVHVLGRLPDLIRQREAEYRALARAKGRVRVSSTQLAQREVFAEVAAALNLSESQVSRRVDQADRLVRDFPMTLFETRAGMLSAQHAQAIVSVGTDIHDRDIRVDYERLALDMARELTVAQLTAALEVIVDRVDPDGTQDRIRAAKAERGVRKRTLIHGMSQLIVTAPTAEVEGTFTRLGDMAGEIHADNQADAAEHAQAQAAGDADDARDPIGAAAADGHGTGAEAGVMSGQGGVGVSDADDASAAGGGSVVDERSVQNIMADLALDLLLTSAPDGHGDTWERRDQLGAIRATVHITIPAATLTGTGTGGANVIGAGQIDDHTARTLAGDADHWYRIFIDPTTGTPITVDRRHPCTAQKRLLRARDERCRFPGCRRPARKSDIDHTIPWAEGGPTSLRNLGHLTLSRECFGRVA